MVKKKTLRLPDKLAEELEKAAKQLPIASENELMIKAITHYLTCSKVGLEGPKLMRSPIDTTCSECTKNIPFGSWCYYHPQQGTLCPECGVQRGWTPKDRIKRLIENYELKLDNQELKRQIKEDLETWADLKEKINIWKLGERHEQLEQQKAELIKIGIDFMKKDFATPEEKQSIQKTLDKVAEIEKLQEKIIEEIARRTQIFQKKKKRKKKKVEVAA